MPPMKLIWQEPKEKKILLTWINFYNMGLKIWVNEISESVSLPALQIPASMSRETARSTFTSINKFIRISGKGSFFNLDHTNLEGLSI